MTKIALPTLRRTMETRMTVSKAFSPRRRQVLLPAISILGAVTAPTGFAGTLATLPPIPLAEMFEADRARITSEIIKIANRIANESQYFDEDMRPIAITGSFNLETKIFEFDMEERFGPEAGYDELADMHRSIENAIQPLIGQSEGLYTVSWTYGGKDIEHWMPRPHSDDGTPAGPVGA